MELHIEPGLPGDIVGRAARVMLITALLAAVAAAGNPQTLGRESVVKIFSPDGGEYERYGGDVAIDGGVAVIGESEIGDIWPSGPGTAYVYRYDADEGVWALETQLDPWGPDDGVLFGSALDIDGEIIAVGSWAWADEEGRVFVFRYDPDSSSWTNEQILEGDPPGSFGGCVSISGDTIITDGPGGAFVFRYDPDASAWIREQQLVPDDDYHAVYAVDIEGDRAVVGYCWYDSNTGTAVVFEYDPETSLWVQTSKLDASDAAEYDRFGMSVRVEDDFIAVGAPDPDIMPDEPEAVYVFVPSRDSWEEVAMITPYDGGIGDNFGSNIDLNGRTIIVGSRDNGPDGAAYVYDFDPQTYGWSLRIKLLPSGPEPHSFGASVAIHGYRALVGDSQDCELATYAGAAYIFELPGNDCPADVNCDETVDIDDLFQVLGAWGLCDDCPEDIDDSGVVDIDDIFAVLADWGPC
ncbi:MAG: hypothetical protein JSV91_03345 [Phycisphaerales bacterium]|nr:MAG: hypothetical protein JSV91_03345 [Phycisphaerales bacterium]